jgi:hypothetical protein
MGADHRYQFYINIDDQLHIKSSPVYFVDCVLISFVGERLSVDAVEIESVTINLNNP